MATKNETVSVKNFKTDTCSLLFVLNYEVYCVGSKHDQNRPRCSILVNQTVLFQNWSQNKTKESNKGVANYSHLLKRLVRRLVERLFKLDSFPGCV